MESILKRPVFVLAIVLIAQVLGLAVQVKRPSDNGSLLIRTWAIGGITPIEKGFVHTQRFVQGIWTNYFYLREVRKENERLKEELQQARLEQVRLHEDAAQAHRMQVLLGFREQYISKTVAAQVIGTSGSEQSRVVYIDRGSNDGIEANMAVVTAEGVVGKILHVQPTTSQVLEITDQTSGVGATLEKSRLQGILKGAPAGDAQLNYIMSDEKVEAGERILTSGGDRIFPKGLPLGTVMQVSPGKDLFLSVRVKPAADLNRLEEVLVITKIEEREPTGPDVQGPIRASDILAERLPSVPTKPPEGATPTDDKPAASGAPNATAPKPSGGTTPAAKPPATAPAQKPAPTGAQPTKPATTKPPASATDKPKSPPSDTAPR